MRLIKIKLSRSTPVWILNPIHLTEKNPESPFIEVDLLTPHQKDIIQSSRENGEILIFNKDDNPILSIDDIKPDGEYAVNIADVIDKETIKINAVTVHVEEEVEAEEENVEPSEADFEYAKMILNKNGNTVKKVIASFTKTKETIALLDAFLQEETKGRNRNGIICSIKERIKELENG